MEPQQPPAERPNPGLILVIDDDFMYRQVLKEILSLDDYEVLLAPGGREGLELARTHPVDAILLDVMMPDMDGYAVLQELQRDPVTAEIPVLFVSAEAVGPESVRRGLDLGARDYIPKPLSKPELLARISSVVRIYRMERELRRMNESLRELDRRRRHYLAMASHDLRVPLTSVASYCTLLLRGGYGPVGDEQSHAVDRIRSLAGYMGVLVNNLLDLERIETGELKTTLAPIEIPRLLSETAEMHRPIARQRDIELIEEVRPDLPRPMLDRQMMLQILNNLIGNALKFSSAGTRVSVGAKQENGSLVLWVADGGPGIPSEEQPLLFRPFQQLSVKSRTDERGAGLGLCIVKNLAELQGGIVSLRSAPGEGTRFSITFPLRTD